MSLQTSQNSYIDYTATQKKSGTFNDTNVFLCILSRRIRI